MNANYTPPEAPRPEHFEVREALAVVQDQWLWIVAIAGVVALAALFYALVATPVYQTNALIQVEEKSSGINGIVDLTSALTGETPTEAEIEIIRSRAVLGAAVEQQKLYLEASPLYFPVVGAAIARSRETEGGPAGALLGLQRYGWGGEKIRVDRLDVPRALQGETLHLVKGAADRYELFYGDEILVAGEVGRAAENSGISVFVSQLQARPGTHFKVVRHNWLSALEQLSASLLVAERGKQTGILELTLQGRDPEQIADTLNAITTVYLRQNVERTSEDAAKTLAFLDSQLPDLKGQLDAAEAALNQHRIQQGSVDLSLETQGLLEKLGDVDSKLSELQLQQAELSQRFTAEHPVRVALDQQRGELASTRAEVERQIRKLPAAEQDSVRLMRDVRVANELYVLLLNRAQELKVVRAGTVGNIRIIDEAFTPLRPFKPRRALIVSTGTLLGLLLALMIVFLREALNSAIRDPDELEKSTGLPVYAIVPHSEVEHDLSADRERPLLFEAQGNDVAIESLRSLRTSLDFLLLDAEKNIVSVGGPAPAAGKSFVVSNLAALFAQTGKSVLLVDADLRRGRLHRLFGLPRRPGLTELIAGNAEMENVVRKDVVAGLDFIPTGVIPPNPAELITSPRFAKLLDTLAPSYDLILLDAPPILGAAEAVALARQSAINLLVARSEQQTPREVHLALTKLRQSGATVNGFVLNDLRARARHAYTGYSYYRYDN